MKVNAPSLGYIILERFKTLTTPPPILWGIGLDPLKVWQVVMPKWHVDSPELAHYSARGDAPIEKWPGQPVTT